MITDGVSASPSDTQPVSHTPHGVYALARWFRQSSILYAWISAGLLASIGTLPMSSTVSAHQQAYTAVAGVDQDEPPPAPPAPVRLIIPSLRVNAPIQDVAFDDDGAMSSPSGPDNVAWFAPGFRPGDPGNAVIAGHVDWVDRAAVLWLVQNLGPGDEIDVVYDDGSSAAFAVDEVDSYDDSDAPMDQIFAASDVPHLNLVTCGGTFNRVTHNYDHRTVVYSTLIPE
jgi:sortase A